MPKVVSVSHKRASPEAPEPCAHTVCIPTAFRMITALSHRTVIYRRDDTMIPLSPLFFGAFLFLCITEGPEVHIYSGMRGLNTLARGM